MSGKKYIMAFRSPEYVQRNELVQFRLQVAIRAPANTQEQEKKGYKFHVFFFFFFKFILANTNLTYNTNNTDNTTYTSSSYNALIFIPLTDCLILLLA